ncbi:hypothetical protein MTO96_002213 [Rhipicephalus appendiculatus]
MGTRPSLRTSGKAWRACPKSSLDRKRSPSGKSQSLRPSPFSTLSRRRLEDLWFWRKNLDTAVSDLAWRTCWFPISGSPNVLEDARLPPSRTGRLEDFDKPGFLRALYQGPENEGGESDSSPSRPSRSCRAASSRICCDRQWTPGHCSW